MSTGESSQGGPSIMQITTNRRLPASHKNNGRLRARARPPAPGRHPQHPPLTVHGCLYPSQTSPPRRSSSLHKVNKLSKIKIMSGLSDALSPVQGTSQQGLMDTSQLQQPPPDQQMQQNQQTPSTPSNEGSGKGKQRRSSPVPRSKCMKHIFSIFSHRE